MPSSACLRSMLKADSKNIAPKPLCTSMILYTHQQYMSILGLKIMIVELTL